MTNQPKTQLEKIHGNLNQLIKVNASAFPAGFNDTRFIQNAMAVLQDTPDLEQMEPRSIARTLLRGAFLNLDFFNSECYAIPYNKNIAPKGSPAKYVKELQFQTDYKGEVKLVKKYSIEPVNKVYAKIVREGDFFEDGVVDGSPFLNFKPKSFSEKPIIGVFAVCLYENGSMIYEKMTTAEVESVRDKYSKVPKGPAWTNRFGEMAKKTVLRLLCKGIQIEFDNAEADEAFKVGADAEFTDFEDVTEEPIKMPTSTQKPTEPDSGDLLPHILSLIHAEDAPEWLEKETSFKGKDGNQVAGKDNLGALTPKQRPFVFRAARKELVEKADKMAVELYPEKDEREKALAGMAEGLMETKDMHTADQVKVYEILLNLKLDKQAKATEAK